MPALREERVQGSISYLVSTFIHCFILQCVIVVILYCMLTKNRIISIIASNAKVLLFNIYKQKDQFLKSLMVSFIWGWGAGGGGAASRSIIYSVYILSYPKKVSNVCVDKKKIVWPPITTCGNERPFLLVKLLSTRGKMETLFYFVCPVKARCFF